MSTEEQIAALRQEVQELKARQEAQVAALFASLRASRTALHRRWAGSCLLLTPFLALTLLCARRAWAVATVPNQTEFTVQVAAGQASAATAWPVSDSPITLTAATIDQSARGTGFVHLTYSDPTGNPAVTWTGFHANDTVGSDAISTGFTTAPDLPIIKLGNGNVIEVRTAGTAAIPNQFKVVNTTMGATFKVVIEMMW